MPQRRGGLQSGRAAAVSGQLRTPAERRSPEPGTAQPCGQLHDLHGAGPKLPSVVVFQLAFN